MNEPIDVQQLKSPGKPPRPFKPGVDPVPVPNPIQQHPLFSSPEEAIPI
jgi:hypothetical protein